MKRSYFHCCCRNESVIFSHCVNLKLGHLLARISLLESLVRSKLLYSVQAWQLTSKSKNKLEVVYRRFVEKNGQEW